MKVHEVAQGTSAWLKLRMGIPTVSCFDHVITPTGGASQQADGYMHHLLAERVVGKPIDGFKSKYMELGNQFEDNAVASYEFVKDCTTFRVGFITTDDDLIGCSPDRFITERPEGMLEAKAPSAAVHISYLLSSIGASKKYKVQLQGELWICEKDWVDINSYCEGMPDALYRVHRDEVFIREMSARVRSFSSQLEEKAIEFRERGWIKDPAPVTEPENPFGITDEDMIWKPLPEWGKQSPERTA